MKIISLHEIAQPRFYDLGVQPLQIHRQLRGLARRAEDAGSAVQQLAPPFGHLVGMHVALVRDVRNRLVVAQSLNGRFGLEWRSVVPAGSSTHLLRSSNHGLYLRPSEQLFRFAPCSDFRSHLCGPIPRVKTRSKSSENSTSRFLCILDTAVSIHITPMLISSSARKPDR